MKEPEECDFITEKDGIKLSSVALTVSQKVFHCPACLFFDKVTLRCAWHPQWIVQPSQACPPSGKGAGG